MEKINGFQSKRVYIYIIYVCKGPNKKKDTGYNRRFNVENIRL